MKATFAKCSENAKKQSRNINNIEKIKNIAKKIVTNFEHKFLF